MVKIGHTMPQGEMCLPHLTNDQLLPRATGLFCASRQELGAHNELSCHLGDIAKTPQ